MYLFCQKQIIFKYISKVKSGMKNIDSFWVSDTIFWHSFYGLIFSDPFKSIEQYIIF